MLHLALEVAHLVDFVPDFEEFGNDDLNELEDISELDLRLICKEYNGYGIDSIETEIVQLSRQFL